MTIEEQLDCYLKEKDSKSGSIKVYPDNGSMLMGEMFSSTGFIDMISRESPRDNSRFDVLTNLGEYVPLIMCLNVNVKPSIVIESFQTSMKNFDRGAAYPLIWRSQNQRRGDLEVMKRSFFDYQDSFNSYETATSYLIKSNCLLLAVRDMLLQETRICLCATVKREDFKFVMALRRHGKVIPRDLITVFLDNTFDTPEFRYAGVRDFYRKKIRMKLIEAGIRIERTSPEFMSTLVYKADYKFSNFSEMKEKRESSWKFLLNSRV